ncbi:prostate androgen-regulated mucin-like protein 1 homolog [Hypanus sabinus]|uniref:prostate androgen-regulated mucin-like protein 1 homolog n=1 Tax=Hypanus sabinus TaxID=79690 RepID=UPI0028C4AB17|nr:prostate androgen-regulated mucin-like protein 1 homolog [Hypanus sabinus]
MWAKLMFIAWQHFIFSSANDSTAHETQRTGFSTDVSTFLSENSPTTFTSATPLVTSLQNTMAHSTKVGRNSENGTATRSISSIFNQTFLPNTNHSNKTVPLNTAAMNLTFENNTDPNVTIAPNTIAPNATCNSSVTVTSYSPTVTNSSVEEEITTNTTDSPIVNSTAQPVSLHSLTSNTSFTSQEPTSFTTSIEYRKTTAINVSTTTFTHPVVSTTLVSSSSITPLLSKNHSNTSAERGNTFAAPSKTGTTLIAAVCLVLVAAALLGVVMYLKKRRVFYSRLQEDNPIESWSNYNNPVYEDP